MEDQARFRRFKGGCPFYRENWVIGTEHQATQEVVLYEIYCLRDMPPFTQEEQDKCMRSRYGCWRIASDRKPPRRAPTQPDAAWPSCATSAGT